MRPDIYARSMARSFRHSPGLAAQYLLQSIVRLTIWTAVSPLMAILLVWLILEEARDKFGSWFRDSIVRPFMNPIWDALDRWRSNLNRQLIERRKAWEAATGGDHE